jgi:hypothetical protein
VRVEVLGSWLDCALEVANVVIVDEETALFVDVLVSVGFGAVVELVEVLGC